jgi:hypothetical protein
MEVNMDFFKKNYLYILCIIFGFALGHYLFPKVITKEVPSEPIVIKTETKDVTNASVVNPEVQGEVVRFIDRGTSLSAVINGKEYIVPNTTGQSQVKLGENSTLKLEHESQGKLDITPVVNQMLALERQKWERENIKHFEVGGIVSNKGAAPKIGYENYNYKVGIFYTPDFYGFDGGLRF